MKAYADSLDYQGLVTAFEIAENAFQEAKNQKKKVRDFFKSTKKEAESKAPIRAAHLKYKQAKLAQKFEALTARAAELDLQEFVLVFKQNEKAEAKATKKTESTQKVKSSKNVGNATDSVEKPASKEGKTKSTTKVSKQVTESKEAAKAAKKVEKKGVPEAKVKGETTKKMVAKASKATKKSADKLVIESAKPVTVAQEAAAEKPVAKTSKVVEKPLAKTEVIVLNKMTINDLTVIEGIGPKIAQILAKNKVKNFKSLMSTPIEDIKAWLKDNKLPFIDPTTWATQAELLDAGKMVEFEVLKQELKGGKRTQV
jgi:predicted flap endonuclease-1-like 5' DNA nuclease